MTNASLPRRRSPGTGSVYQDSRGHWVASLEVGWTSRGTRRRVRRTAKSEAAANRILLDMLREDPTTLVAPRTATVKTWAEQWLPLHAREVRPHAYSTDRAAVTKWILPTIGHKRLHTLTPGDVRAVDVAGQRAGLAPSSVVRTRRVLVKMLRDARSEGHQVPERCFDVKAPPAGETTRAEIPVTHAMLILAAADTQPDGSRWAAAFLQGLRPAEALGLTWAHVHDDHLDISWQLKALPYVVPYDRSSGFRTPPGYVTRHLVDSWHLVRPKTAAGRRRVPLTPWLAASLDRWRTVQEASPYGLVWPREDGRPRSDSDDRARWRALLELVRDQQRAGVPDAPVLPAYDLYSARHATVTLLKRAGVEDAIVEAIVGHAKLVQSYRHVNTVETMAAVDALARALGRG